MSEELEPTKTPDQIDRIAEHHDDLSKFVMEEVPAEAVITRNLAAYWGVFIDENGVMDPPQDSTNLEFLRAIVALETRVILLERKLGKPKS